MPIHPSSLTEDELLAACDQRFDRRSGPGGQHRNKVETAVILTHRESGLSAEANERRSQQANRVQALFRLRLTLAVKIRTSRPLSAVPGPEWSARVKAGPIRVSPEHRDFPLLLAEVLDVLEQTEYQPAAAAEILKCSSSQLVRLCRLFPPAFKHVNDERLHRGFHRLK